MRPPCLPWHALSMKNKSSTSGPVRCHNRIAAIMAHTSRYSFRGTSRLAKDAGVAKSTICHLTHGQSSPMYVTLKRIVSQLEFQIARRLGTREIVSEDGTYKTPFVCQLVGCAGCMPERAFHPDGTLKDEWSHVQPGKWTGDVAEFEGLN